MQLPNININGTSRAQLLEQYMVALDKCQQALQAVQAIDVHGRDYQGIPADIGGNAVSVAFSEHQERCQALRRIVNDLSKIAEHIDQG